MKYWKNEIKHVQWNNPASWNKMAQCFYLGPSLLGAEFVRVRVCQWPEFVRDRDLPESLKIVSYIGPALGQDNRAELTQADLTQADWTQGQVDPHSCGTGASHHAQISKQH